MRYLRTLAVAFALTASVAACSDAPSPTVADDVAPRQGRMLSPGQASMVKPGDFIIYRPEDYAKFGISAFSASAAAPSAYYGECQIRPIDHYYEEQRDGCGGQVCYDVNGGPIPCGSDPCYDQYGNNLCTPPPPPPPSSGATATYNYGSSAPYDGEVNNGGIILKQLRLISFSQSLFNVASFTVDAAFKNVGAAGGAGCNNTAQAFDNAHASATGSQGYIEVSRVAQWLGTVKWQVDGVHSFTPVSGASGGGTFYSTASFCG